MKSPTNSFRQAVTLEFSIALNIGSVSLFADWQAGNASQFSGVIALGNLALDTSACYRSPNIVTGSADDSTKHHTVAFIRVRRPSAHRIRDRRIRIQSDARAFALGGAVSRVGLLTKLCRDDEHSRQMLSVEGKGTSHV